MSGWRRLLEEESEHQWLSFAVFSIIVIIGSILIDWSSDLSGVQEGSSLGVNGLVMDSTDDSVLYQSEDGNIINYKGHENSAQYATCLEEYEDLTLACLGTEGMVAFIGDGGPECDTEWCQFSIGENLTASQISGNGLALLLIVQDGTSDSLAAIWYGDSNPQPVVSEFEETMYLETIIPTDEGWLIGGSWQAPPNWLGSNPASPPKYELIIKATWDGIAAPAIEVVHVGGEGVIHGLFESEDGYLATGTSDTYLISETSVEAIGLSSRVATDDNNGNVWLFGDIGSKTVAIVSGNEITVEKLPEPLKIVPAYATCDEDGMISVHGSDYNDEVSAFSIDSNARTSFTSLRGILDLGFILVSLLILSIMGWNISDAIRKGEVF
ncbi:MAG: hypothetical protein ACPHAT_00215 [Candidatus Poseidoniaceae archaeon]